MKPFRCLLLQFVGLFLLPLAAQAQVPPLLDKAFDLGKPPINAPQYFVMESRLTKFAPDGTRLDTDTYRLRLQYDPKLNEAGGYRCVNFALTLGDSLTVQIPALQTWTYIIPDSGRDVQGQVFGIDHSRFDNLTDDRGRALPTENAYHVYNAFIDFHAICTLFSEPVPDGPGIQDLKRIGQHIVHEAAFSQPPTNLGAHIAEGSYFKNGEITLDFKGLTVENGHACALIGYDSGQSAFKMILHPMPDMEIVTVGSSHYWGEISKSLTTHWAQKATLVELVVSETRLPMPPGKVNSVIERHLDIRNVAPEAFYNF